MKLSHWLLAITVPGLLSMPVSAGVITQPGNATACCGTYDTGTTLFVLPGPDRTLFSSLTSGLETLTFSNTLTTLSVPSTWGTWSSPPVSESSTPVLGWDPVLSDTLTLSMPVAIFGFELEPTDYGLHNFTVDFFNGTTSVGSISLGVEGDGGALLFAQEVIGNQIEKITISGDTPDGFALANIRFAETGSAAVPEPGSGLLILLGAALGSLRLVFHKK
jgi:hypothetical protein